MPFYVYEVVLEGEDEPGQRFEVFQKMSDPPLTKHPTTGQPVRRVISAPYLGGKNSDAAVKRNLSDKRLGELGFTKYVKTDKGRYEKTAGSGPDQIKAPNP
ncbi:MAG: zinc ribbon domain-containing protein [Phycisphaeraceae bacterium]|nr:zinc ribbon domain-containing protein [Phycisphaeraceae bacterium]